MQNYDQANLEEQSEQAAAAFEAIPAEEPGEIDETAALTVELQDKRAQNVAEQGGCPLRGVHAKSHGCVKATFEINCDVPEKYRVGLFAEPGKVFEAWVRFSNAAVLREDDLKANSDGERQNGSRGMAVKVLDVGGEVLNKDDGRHNQDFLMINTPEFAFANVRDYLRLNRILGLDQKGANPGPFFLPLRLLKLGEPQPGESEEVTNERNGLLGKMAHFPMLNGLSKEDLMRTGASFGVIKKIESKVVRNPLQVQYFGAAPFLFGEGRVMKFSAAPCESIDQGTIEALRSEAPSPNYLKEALGATMSGCDEVCFDFMIQIREAGEGELNIEDVTTTWDNELDNYKKVAKITFKAPQTPHGESEEAHCEALAFTPWHSLAEHRPLGGINRLRRKVYDDSAAHRGAKGY